MSGELLNVPSPKSNSVAIGGNLSVSLNIYLESGREL